MEDTEAVQPSEEGDHPDIHIPGGTECFVTVTKRNITCRISAFSKLEIVLMKAVVILAILSTVFIVMYIRTDKNASKGGNEQTNKHWPHSCFDLYQKGTRTDGIYAIDPDGHGAFKVRCDMTTSGGGWTVFQRRMDGSVKFYRGWNSYKKGFGNLNGEFWLGLDQINRLTESGQNVLRVDMEDFKNEKRYAEYKTFDVLNEAEKYKLTIGRYFGDADDSLAYHNGMNFSTKDKDNDESRDNCAEKRKGAWWYSDCLRSNLNGRYLLGYQKSGAIGVTWKYWKGFRYSLKKTEMKIRPRSF